MDGGVAKAILEADQGDGGMRPGLKNGRIWPPSTLVESSSAGQDWWEENCGCDWRMGSGGEG